MKRLYFTGPPVPITARLHSTPQGWVCHEKKKNTLPLEAGGCGASTPMSSLGPGPRGHAVVFPRQSI
eukprot:7381843-Pyramimonas_sp.AAC.1